MYTEIIIIKIHNCVYIYIYIYIYIYKISPHKYKTFFSLVNTRMINLSKPKPEPELKIDVKVNKKRLEKLGKDFDELRQVF